jgi:bacteriocin biosynthesis cyclodehydratase domain-containing protein
MRAVEPARPEGAVRLRPLVETVRDGEAVYLLRGPAGGDCVVREPPPAVLALLELLRAGGTASGLAATLAASGLAVDAGEVAGMLADLEAQELLEPVPAGPPVARLARQLLYLGDRCPPGTDAAAMQARVRAAHVVVIGCGGLGCWAAAGLACIGVGRLTLVDDDTVEESNLNRQILFRASDIGRPKVEAAARTLRGFDPGLEVRALRRAVDGPAAVRDVIRGADVVLGLADRPPYAIGRWINAAALAERVAYLGAGQLPPLIRVGPLVVPGETACTGCHELALREATPLYDRLEALRRADLRPLATLGPASGIVGSVLAMEVLHHLTGLVAPATRGAVWTLDLRTLAAAVEPVARRADCPLGCGQPHGEPR